MVSAKETWPENVKIQLLSSISLRQTTQNTLRECETRDAMRSGLCKLDENYVTHSPHCPVISLKRILIHITYHSNLGVIFYIYSAITNHPDLGHLR